MNKSNTTLASKKGMSTLARAKFAPGMLLQHEDLEQLNYYTRDLSRIMFRSLFGCGVICGLVVKTDPDCGVKITIGAGVALSCSGDPIEVPNDVTVQLNPDCEPNMDGPLWVVLCGTVKCCAPRTSMCETDDDETKSECTREREGYEIQIVSERPACICGCPEPNTVIGNDDPAGAAAAGATTDGPVDTDCKCANPAAPCYVDHYAGLCGCHCNNCSDCDCKCILLARLDPEGDTGRWLTDHSVRRSIRPVLMRDHQVELEMARTQPPPDTGGDPLDVTSRSRMGGKVSKSRTSSKGARVTTG